MQAFLSWERAACNANNSVVVVERACLGKQSCLLTACLATHNGVGKCTQNSSQNFGRSDPCLNVRKQLAAEIHCSGDPPGASCKDSCYGPPVPSPWGCACQSTFRSIVGLFPA